MATASFEPDASPSRQQATQIDRVGDDMRAIFGPAVPKARAAGLQALVHRPVTALARRSPWRRAVAVLAAGGAAGALLGWWVLATPQGELTVVRPVPSDRAARVAAPSVPPVAATEPADVRGAFVPRRHLAPLSSSPASGADYDAPDAPDVPSAPPAFAAAPVPARPPLVEAAAVPDDAPRFAGRRTADSGCARYADACGDADVRDAELQFREAYAAAAAAGADPRALVAVRRRWARLRMLDGERADLLVTDYARLAGRLVWLANAADGAIEGRQ